MVEKWRREIGSNNPKNQLKLEQTDIVTLTSDLYIRDTLSSRQEEKNMKIKCSNCKSSNLLKQGFRINHNGKKQKYQCIDCKKWFVEDDGFKRMRFKKKLLLRQFISTLMDFLF